MDSLTGNGKPQQGALAAKQLQPTMATRNPALSTTNLLHELDAAAQEVIGKVAAAQVSTLCALQPSHHCSHKHTMNIFGIMIRIYCRGCGAH